MAKGQRTKAGHIIQMIWHGANPNLFNPNGKRVVAHNAEDYDFIDGIEFDKLSRKGAKALIANVPLEEMWTGNIKGPLHYNLMDDQIFPFWIAKGTETPITIDGVPCIDTEYVRPQLDRADREFFSIEEGKAGGGSSLGCYGMFTSFKWTSKRGNKGKSRFEVGFATQAAVRRASLTGGAAQNHKTRISVANVASALGLSIVVPGVAAKAVNLPIGNTAAQNIAAFAAVGLTIASTGTIANASGKTQTVNFSGTGALTIGGLTVDTIAPETPAQFLARLNNANPARQVTLGLPASIVSGAEFSGGTASASSTYPGLSPTYAFDNDDQSRWAAQGEVATLSYVLSSAKIATVAKIYPSLAGGSPDQPRSFNIKARNGTGAYTNLLSVTNYNWIDTNPVTFKFANTTPYIEYQLDITAAGGQNASVRKLAFSANETTAVALTFIDAAGAGNAADFPVTGTGATSASTAPGAAGGLIDLEFTAPANTLVVVNKATGDAGYAISTPQYGSDGSILQAMKADDPIMPGHLFLYSADTPIGLEDEANMVGQIGEWEIDDPKICMPVSHHTPVKDPERPNLPATYNAHAEEESQEDSIKLSVTMDADDDGTVIASMQSLLRASGARLVSKPRYWRIAAIHPGSPQRVYLDFYGSVGAAVPIKWGGSVEQYTFVYDLLENKTAPWNFKAKTRRLA